MKEVKIYLIKKKVLLLISQLFVLAPAIHGVNENISGAKNSIKETIPLISTINATDLNSNNSIITIEYSDALGRTNMAVQKGITPTKNDLVSVVNYDCFDQVCNQWLPTPVAGAMISTSSTIIQQAKTFYADEEPRTSVFRPTDVQSTSTALWNSNIQLCKPGQAWHAGDKRETQEQLSFDINDPRMKLKRYMAEDDELVLADDIYGYTSNVMLKTDEDGHEAYTFTDAFGRTLLHRTINNGENHDTYYIYDDMGRLRFVLSPEASDRMATPGTYPLGSEINGANDPLAQYAYIYKYDEQGRCISKKLPGKDWLNLMYDVAGHLIFSQDGNQRTTGQWTYYKYDMLDRLIQSGTTTLSDADVSLIQTTYSQSPYVETYVQGTGYTSNCRLGTNSVLLTQNFYDTYDFLNLSAFSAYKSQLAYSTLQPGYDLKYSNPVDGVDIATQGMLTGTTVAMLDKTATIFTAHYYNDKGRIVQSVSRNILKGGDREFYNYSFTGKVLRKLHMHNTSYNVNISSDIYTCRYDFADRLTDVWHKSKYRTDSVKLCSYQYDELSRPVRKILHDGLHTINYGYNIQSWLKTVDSPLFSETLYYQDGQSGSPCYYNGSIGAVCWGAGANRNKKYDYYYDGLNRLLNASFSPDGKYNEEVLEYDKNGNINWISRNGCYDLTSSGGGFLEGGTMDLLNNIHSGNQLRKSIDDAEDGIVLAGNDFKDDDNSREVEYFYDQNGNMTADANKGIALIKYNILNLPEKIHFVNGNMIEYAYDAVGVKHKSRYITALEQQQIPLGQTWVNPPANLLKKDSVDYCAGYIYLNKKIDKLLTPEGYMQASSTYNNWDNWKYCYFLKDHQGNTRVNLFSDYVSYHSTTSYTASGQIDYYPFGMEITPPGGVSSGKNPYLYSGKELDRMHGLNQYDFSARWYDSPLGIFTTPDPLAEWYYGESPYVYCSGDPVNRIDPTGMYNYEGIETSCESVEIVGFNARAFLWNAQSRAAADENADPENHKAWSPDGAKKEGGSGGGDNADLVNNIKNVANGFNAAIGLMQHSLQKELASRGHSAQEVKTLVKDAFDTKGVKILGIAGKVMGVTSMLQHTGSAIDAYEKGDWNSLALNSGKLVLDGVFMFGKSVNPVFLGASVVYGVADYVTSDY